MPNLNWIALNSLQLGKYAEYFAKMELSSYGFDVYTSEVDDHGIDFVVKINRNKFLEFQVKSILRTDYVYMTKRQWDITDNSLFLFLMIFEQNQQPQPFIIPATAWQKPNDLMKVRDYDGLKSEPEYGMNLSQKNRYLLEQYRLDIVIKKLISI